ncbi:MAG: HAD family phosphatase [Planctomycetes bacterium]|nr:HAD family phosphatase [Planctomycetota bacterium]
MIERFKAILLDFDGVIADSEHSHAKAIELTLREIGIELMPDDKSWFPGVSDENIFRKILARENRDHDTKELKQRKKQTLLEVFEPKFIEGAVSFIEKVSLDAETRLAVVSSTFRDELRAMLDVLGVTESFELILAGDEVTNRKPDPEPYLTAAKRLEVSSQECVVVEDSFNGIRSAIDAGTYSVALTTSYTREQILGGGLNPDLIVSNYDELENHLGLE